MRDRSDNMISGIWNSCRTYCFCHFCKKKKNRPMSNNESECISQIRYWKGYFHSTIFIHIRRNRLSNLRQKRARGGLMFPIGCFFWFLFLFMLDKVDVVAAASSVAFHALLSGFACVGLAEVFWLSGTAVLAGRVANGLVLAILPVK